MRFHRATHLLFFAMLVGTLVGVTGSGRSAHAVPPPEQTWIWAGVAEIDITPPEKYPISGYYHERLATGTIDPLKARALVLRTKPARASESPPPETAVVIVCCDLTGIATDLVMEVRRRVARAVNVPESQIILTGSHSHTAPDYFKDLYQYLEKPVAERDASRYAAKLIDRLSQVILTANERTRPVELRAGAIRQETAVSFNRRFVMRDGSQRTWMSLENPEVVRAAGPIDPLIQLVALQDVESQKPLAVLSNFALHLDTVGGTQWSADYPAFIEQAVRHKLGPDVISLFGLGCCGDINHVNPASKVRNKTAEIGQALGATIQQALPDLTIIPRAAQPHSELRVATAKVPGRFLAVTEEQLAAARPLLTDARNGKAVDFFTQVAGYKHLMIDQLRHRRTPAEAAQLVGWGLSHTLSGVGEEMPLEVAVVTVGADLALVFLPGEVFVELGLAIKQASPYRQTLVIELSNACETLYLPTRAAFAGGGYEVTNAALQPGTGELLVETAVRLIGECARPKKE
jgi:neutral ceramidase